MTRPSNPTSAAGHTAPVGQAAPKRTSRLLKLMLGSVFVVIGILGLVLPFLQGAITIAAGVLLIADAVPSVDRKVKQLRMRSPAIDRALCLVETEGGAISIGKITAIVLLTTTLASLAAYLITKLTL